MDDVTVDVDLDEDAFGAAYNEGKTKLGLGWNEDVHVGDRKLDLGEAFKTVIGSYIVARNIQQISFVGVSEYHQQARKQTRESMADGWTEAGAEIAESINQLPYLSHGNSVACGWYDDRLTKLPVVRNVPEMIALMHSELGEALEGYRKDLMDEHIPTRKSVEVELADLLHRVFDLAGYLGLDLGGAYVEKGKYNLIRADHKLEERAKEGGKAF